MRRSSDRSLRRAIFAVLSISLVASACGGGGGSSAPETTTAPPTTVLETTTTTAPPTTTTAAPVLAPLTGLPVAAGQDLNRPVLGVKIDADRLARPQLGLHQADVVYEELIEGGFTRFLAMFHSVDPGIVGPVRSVRPMDGLIMQPLNGMLAFAGGIPVFVSEVRKSGVQIFEEDATGYSRDPKRPRPHNLIAGAATLWTQAKPDRTPPGPLFTFADATPAGGTPAAAVDATFSKSINAHYDYDVVTATWKRIMYGAPHNGVSGAQTVQIAPANVVIMRVAEKQTGQRDRSDTLVFEAVVVGSGEATVLRDGVAITGTWQRPDPAAPAKLVDALGAEIPLKPGQTWVELVPESGGGVKVS